MNEDSNKPAARLTWQSLLAQPVIPARLSWRSCRVSGSTLCFKRTAHRIGTATLGVSSASAPCQALLRIPLGLATRGEREKLASSSGVQFFRVAFRV